jgi:hypothetical protein
MALRLLARAGQIFTSIGILLVVASMTWGYGTENTDRPNAEENWIDNKPVPRKRACLFPHTKYWHKSADHSVLVNALDLVDWWKTPENTATALSAQDRDTKLFPTERDKWMRGPFRDKLRRDS